MSYTKVKNYTTSELIRLARELPSFNKIPDEYWIIGVRSKADTFNVFDDKFYIMHRLNCVDVITGTTNAGAEGLLNFDKWGLSGSAVIKGDEWYYNVWGRGLHNGKMPALRQVGKFKVIRDNNKNKKAGDIDKWSWEENKGLNFHCNNYDLKSTIIKWTIGLWSLGCQVANNIPKYARFLKESKGQNTFTYCLLNEK